MPNPLTTLVILLGYFHHILPWDTLMISIYSVIIWYAYVFPYQDMPEDIKEQFESDYKALQDKAKADNQPLAYRLMLARRYHHEKKGL